MLVLSRFTDQSIVIGHNVRITIVQCRDGKVRLGIEAPRELEVNREEVYKDKFGPFVAKGSNVAPVVAAAVNPDQTAGDDPGPYLQTR
ncbi:MAG TPA: carbon storage regulator [Planctomycetaceae bacterium]|nr:carbon storage regulator [Planctomycetaceae bacterium]